MREIKCFGCHYILNTFFVKVRNTGKKPADDQINLQDLFMTFLPSSLM